MLSKEHHVKYKFTMHNTTSSPFLVKNACTHNNFTPPRFVDCECSAEEHGCGFPIPSFVFPSVFCPRGERPFARRVLCVVAPPPSTCGTSSEKEKSYPIPTSIRFGFEVGDGTHHGGDCVHRRTSWRSLNDRII